MSDARILIICGERTSGEDLQERLTGLGFETPVSVVPNPEEALALTNSRESVLFVIEINPADCSDYCHKISRRNNRSGAGVIVVTEGSYIETIELAMQMNPYGILVKPYSNDQLAATVLTALNQLGLTRNPTIDPPPLDEVASMSESKQCEEIRKSEEPNDLALEDIVPICSGCKQVREPDGAWTQIEHYLRSRYKLWFTHTLCPECLTIYANWTRELAADDVHRPRR